MANPIPANPPLTITAPTGDIVTLTFIPQNGGLAIFTHLTLVVTGSTPTTTKASDDQITFTMPQGTNYVGVKIVLPDGLHESGQFTYQAASDPAVYLVVDTISIGTFPGKLNTVGNG
jgi:hypothetical protein